MDLALAFVKGSNVIRKKCQLVKLYIVKNSECNLSYFLLGSNYRPVKANVDFLLSKKVYFSLYRSVVMKLRLHEYINDG